MPALIRFLLNDREVETSVSPGMLVLDYLRREQRATGTKEGCREGDCGACAVLVGELEGDACRYLPVTSCLMPVGELEGKHLVTIEGLNMRELTPVQQAIVDEGASQCGFCTPGIVVSLTGLLMDDDAETDGDAVKKALSGHLCRCTGYRSLKRSGALAAETVGRRTGVEALVDRGLLPEYFGGVPDRLRQLARDGDEAAGPEDASAGEAAAVFVAGGTDIYVQRGEELADVDVGVLNLRRDEMRGISRANGHLRLGALTTFEEFGQHPEVRELVPDVASYMILIASWQIRNRATVGGNVINASPIGDMTILLQALGAVLVLSENGSRREVPLAAFYRGYKELDKAPGEILTEILIPVPPAGTRVHFEKVSKRKCLDIATVNSAVSIREVDGVVAAVALAVGGVAPVPLVLERTAAYLLGKPIEKATVDGVLRSAQQELTPISDVRGSAAYKRLLVRQQLFAKFTRLFPETLEVKDFYAAH